jgi:hypothetical protein
VNISGRVDDGKRKRGWWLDMVAVEAGVSSRAAGHVLGDKRCSRDGKGLVPLEKKDRGFRGTIKVKTQGGRRQRGRRHLFSVEARLW